MKTKKRLRLTQPPMVKPLSDQAELRAIRQELFDSRRVPSFRLTSEELFYTGSKISLRMDDYATPIFDLSKRCIEKGENSTDRVLYATLQGVDGPLLVPCKWIKKTNVLEIDIPKKAQSGILVLLTPVEVKNDRASGDESEICSTVKVDNAPLPVFFTGGIIEARTIYFPEIVSYIRVTCGQCQNPSTSICPHGAIRFDTDGYCYVDQDRCIGQSRTYDSVGNLPETTCWDCFPQNSTNAYSSLCTYGVFQKALSLGINCCGCCSKTEQVIQGICLRQLCDQNAIGGGFPSPYIDDQGNEHYCERCPGQTFPMSDEPLCYTVDQMKCTGCMICYSNILCSNPAMKGFIRPKKQFSISVRTIELEPIYPELPDFHFLQLILCVWGEKDGKVFKQELPLNITSKKRVEINRTFESTNNLHFAVLGINKSGSRIPLSYDARPGIAVVSPSIIGGDLFHTTIKTRFGNFRLVLENQNKD